MFIEILVRFLLILGAFTIAREGYHDLMYILSLDNFSFFYFFRFIVLYLVPFCMAIFLFAMVMKEYRNK